MSIIHNLHMILPFPRIEANHNFRESPVAREWRLVALYVVPRVANLRNTKYLDKVPREAATLT